MQLTRQADYAVRVVLDLSVRPQRQSRTREIARRQRIPPAFLRKIVQTLARAGFVRTVRGADGGVRLVREPAATTLRQVIEAGEGPGRLNRCLIRRGGGGAARGGHAARVPRGGGGAGASQPLPDPGGGCALDRICPVHPVWQHI